MGDREVWWIAMSARPGRFWPPTPVLEGEDAERLLRDLENHASPEEMERRTEAAEKLLAEMTRPKGFPKRPPPR
jgi:hypothetical protein